LASAFRIVTSPVVGSAAAGGTKANVIYNSLVPNGPPSNLPSVGFEATSTSEFGAAVTFAGSARNLNSVTVGMSSFACVTGSWDGGNPVGVPCSSPTGATFSQPNGANPTGVLGPYDSLNVAVSTDGTGGTTNNVTAGTTGSIWLNSSWSGAYADNGATGTFRADTGSWSPYQPAVQFTASS
jgi:hypothetical protein